jgi:hypothetical protein
MREAVAIQVPILGVCKACFRNIRKRLVVACGLLAERGYNLWAKTQKNSFASGRLASRAKPRATVPKRLKLKLSKVGQWLSIQILDVYLVSSAVELRLFRDFDFLIHKV